MNIDSKTDALVRTFGLTFTQPALLPPSSPLWHQFVIAQSIPVAVSVGSTTWLVPPGSGLWAPAGQACSFRNRGKMSLRMIYLPASDPRAKSFDPDRCAVLTVSPLLLELVRRVVLLGALLGRDPHHRRLAGLLWDELGGAQVLPTALTQPSSEPATRFLEWLEPLSFRFDEAESAIRASGVSRRTLDRIFVCETQMSLGAWLRKRRVLLAMDRLSSQVSVSDVAFELGYNGPSAFIQMFKRETGRLPHEIQAAARGG